MRTPLVRDGVARVQADWLDQAADARAVDVFRLLHRHAGEVVRLGRELPLQHVCPLAVGQHDQSDADHWAEARLVSLPQLILRDGDLAAGQLPQGDRRPQDVAFILFRFDAALFFQQAEPLLAVELEPFGGAVDLGLDVGRGIETPRLRQWCSMSRLLTRLSSTSSPNRSTHAWASCWRLMSWPLTRAMTSCVGGLWAAGVDFVEGAAACGAWRRLRARRRRS